jgi:hypothetical protein
MLHEIWVEGPVEASSVMVEDEEAEKLLCFLRLEHGRIDIRNIINKDPIRDKKHGKSFDFY